MKSSKTTIRSFIFLLLITFVSCTNNAQDQEGAVDKPLIENENDKTLSQDQGSSVNAEDNLPVIALDKEVYEFGVVKEGEKVKHVFDFTNTGNAPLIISNVSASCGCTTPEYSKHPINPGEKGSVTVVFDSKNQVGKQQKIITILSNANPSRINVQLIGEVK